MSDDTDQQPEIPEESQSPQSDDTTESRTPSFIVGVGASAGGLKSLEAVFRNTPADTGIGFVVVTHLDPDHQTLLPELLDRITGLEVELVHEGAIVRPNTVHVIPPGQDMAIGDGKLQLIHRDRPAHPIDFFFRSLAQFKGSHAVAVVLSGTGSDGALGAREINDAGGLVIVEDPHTAEYPGMPESAIRYGVVQYILPAHEIPQRIVNYVARPVRPREADGHSLSEDELRDLQRVLYLLKNATGHDFTYYKRSTVVRRISRRMAVHGIDSLDNYADYLQSNKQEAAAMFKELLIGVTSFFRDQDAFEILEKKVITDIVDNKDDRSEIRVWVPGAATGEEAYSVAIALREAIGEAEKNITLRLFATDIDHDAIETARRGIYPPRIGETIDERRLRTYFSQVDAGYKVSRDIREKLVFAEQDVAKDPPFTHLDLVCCRNLLIYLDSSIQEKLIPLFHYALREGGYLFLGKSETLGEHRELFDTVDSKAKIYKRRKASRTPFYPSDLIAAERDQGGHRATFREHTDLKIADLVNRSLLNEFAPPSVITDERGEILYVHGRTGRYLEPAAGRASVRVSDMAREGLSLHLPAMIRKAASGRERVTRKDLRVKTNDSFSKVDVSVMPLTDPDGPKNLLLISFFERGADEAPTVEPEQPARDEHDATLQELRQEIQYTRENLQATIEELETSNEELRSMNEEYQSTNEELKSANEELETSREELQSLNEELTTVNTELQEKVSELLGMEDKMQSYLDGLDSPTVFIDTQLRIRRFTRQATRVVNLNKADIGRPLADITTNTMDDTLASEVRKVLGDMRYREQEVESVDGHRFLRRILPHRCDVSTFEGVVINYVDIEELKLRTDEANRAQEAAHRAQRFAMAIMQTTRDSLVLLDTDLNVAQANRAFYATFHLDPEKVNGHSLLAVLDSDADTENLEHRLRQVLSFQETFDNLHLAGRFPGIGQGRLVLNARTLQGTTDQDERILLGIREATRGETDDAEA
ncbi:PAS domain-containing protein [candidate division GN15 bacterium]|nr:PAS domain-containing protein [candidate division GN15 bacterium]